MARWSWTAAVARDELDDQQNGKLQGSHSGGVSDPQETGNLADEVAGALGAANCPPTAKR